MVLGAGRERVEDGIDPAVGLVLHKKLGERVEHGEPLATLHYNDSKRLEEARALLDAALTLGASPPSVFPLILKTLA